MSRTAHALTPPTIPALRALPAAALALLDAALAAADARRLEVWAVGGALRDLAAGRTPGDLDLALASADPHAAGAIARAAADVLGGDCEIAAAPRFGTASLRRGGYGLGLAALRRERYARPGALPEVRLGARVEDDLPRRDFAVNAIALGLAGPRRGELLDPLGGLADLEARRLRVLHARGFADDATRLWRGARCAAALGLRPDAATAAAIAEAPRWLAAIAGRRLWAEFARTAASASAGAALALLGRWGGLRGAHPRWRATGAAARALRRRPGPHAPEALWALLLAPLPQRDRVAVARRVEAPRGARLAAEDAALLLALPPDAGPAALARAEAAGGAGREAARRLDPARQREVRRALRRWERARSPLGGRDLLALGVAEGPEVGAWLARLRRERWLGTLDGAAGARRLVRAALDAGAGAAGGEARGEARRGR